MPRYTVTMAARNAGSTIGVAVSSVLHSFPADTCVVVWDDGSTDDTVEKARRAGGKKLKIMSSPVSVGAGMARQRIIAATDSEFLVNQDADDISMPWRHRIQSALIQDADIVFTSVLRFSHKRLHRPSLPLSYTPEDVPIALLVHNPFPHSTMLARRAALEDIGGYGEARVAEDYDLWLRAASNGKRIRLHGIPSVAYRISPSQISQKHDFRDHVVNNSELVHSYALLLKKVAPALPFEPKAVHAIEDLGRLDLSFLESLITGMTPILRLRYRRMLSSQRFGELSDVLYNNLQS